jgi:hypothetical protein
MLRDADGQPEMVVERAARLVDVDLGQGRVVRPAGRDHDVIDRRRQALEELREAVGLGGVEGGGAHRVELMPGAPQALGVAGSEDDVGSLGACGPGRFEPAAGASADDDDGLAAQARFALGDSAGGRGGHDSSVPGAPDATGSTTAAISLRSALTAVR